MEKYKFVGDKLAVKGLGSFRVFCACIIFFLLLTLSLFILILTEETNQDQGAQFAILFIFLLMCAVQYFLIRAYLKKQKSIIVFNKKRGSVEFYLDDRYKKISLGRISNWYIQTVLIKTNRGGVYQHYALLVGHRGKVYIGLSAITKTGLKKKLRRINAYFQLGFEESDNIIGAMEAMNQIKRFGGF
tara:strand:- start:361 stop:921 length:561 start_codon:yes stop_codon:yes gene_type:complete